MRTPRFPGQGLLVFLLSLVVVVGLSGSILVGWVRGHVLDEQGYVTTVTPLATNQKIRDEVTSLATDQIASLARGLALDAPLPPRLANARSKAEATARTLVHDTVATYVASPQFRDLWITANRSAHDQIVAILLDKPTTQARSGDVVLNLSAVYAIVRAQLNALGGQSITDTVPWDRLVLNVDVAKSSVLDPAKPPVQAVNDYGGALPIVTAGAAALAILVSRHRRRTAGFLAAGAVAVGLLTIAAIQVLSVVARNQLPDNGKVIGQQAFDIVARSLLHRATVVAVIGAIAFAVIALVPWKTFGRLTGLSTAPPIGVQPYDYGQGGPAFDPRPNPLAPQGAAYGARGPGFPGGPGSAPPPVFRPQPGSGTGQPAPDYGQPPPYGQPSPYGQPPTPSYEPTTPAPGHGVPQPSYDPAPPPAYRPQADPPTTPWFPEDPPAEPPTRVWPD
jgi:hypothetical protein